jgi:5-methylcytosine-specific restriction endonuclease McrA
MFAYTITMRAIYNWHEVQAYHSEGHSFSECQRRFGFSHTAWVKAIHRGELLARPRPWSERRAPEYSTGDRRRIYEWAAVQAYYDEGHSYRECRAKFGFSAGAWTKAVYRGELKARARAKPLRELLSTSKTRAAVKRRLLRDGLLENVCSECGLRQWREKPLAMHIDHINGKNDDHRLDNLRMLCPNCHSQTDTYAGRNTRKARSLQERPRAV